MNRTVLTTLFATAVVAVGFAAAQETPPVDPPVSSAAVLPAPPADEQTIDDRIREMLANPAAVGIAKRISRGTIITAKAYRASAKKYHSKEPEHAARMNSLVTQILNSALHGEDIIGNRRGFFWRGYETAFSPDPEIYSVYVPQWYDDSKKWPLIVSLHGGSSNHNVWMAGLLGHELSSKEYRANFRTPFTALVQEDEAIIAAPQGLGQNHWMGEAQKDVQDVINDVRTYYNIDDNKIFINGLSNGAVATFKIGLENAWRFAAVLPMSGLVDWTSHAAGGGADMSETLVLKNESALTIAENAFNTKVIVTHGAKDPGFDVSQPRQFAARLKKLGIPFVYNEVQNIGHHTTHILWRNMRILKYIREITRPETVNEVRLVMTTERSPRQFWVVLEDRINHLSPGRIRAVVEPSGDVTVETANTARFTLILTEAPIKGTPKIIVDGTVVRLGPYAVIDRITLNAVTDQEGRVSWEPWDGRTQERKRAKLSGPLGDVAWEPQVHVFGTQVEEDTEILKRAAILGARSWTRDPEFTQVRHPVVADTALTPELVRERALVLYGNAKNNTVLKEIGAKLPIPIGEDYIEIRGKRLTGKDVGTKFICPNPLRPNRYLVVMAGVSAEAVERGGNLPLFLPDYIVYNRNFKDPVQRMVLGSRKAIEVGFFTEDWTLPPDHQTDSP